VTGGAAYNFLALFEFVNRAFLMGRHQALACAIHQKIHLLEQGLADEDFIAEDPEAAWAKIGPHALHEANVYESWQTPGQRSAVDVHAKDVDEVRKSGVYRVVTPDECVELASELGDFGTLVLHPLMGGIPPDVAWESLELFERKVLPRLRGAAV